MKRLLLLLLLFAPPVMAQSQLPTEVFVGQTMTVGDGTDATRCVEFFTASHTRTLCFDPAGNTLDVDGVIVTEGLYSDGDIHFLDSVSDRALRGPDTKDLVFKVYNNLGGPASQEFRWEKESGGNTTWMTLDDTTGLYLFYDLWVDGLSCGQLKANGGKVECGTDADTTPSGSNNEVLTDDGASGIVSESNLTFDGSILDVDGHIEMSAADGVISAGGDTTDYAEGPAQFVANHTLTATSNIYKGINATIYGTADSGDNSGNLTYGGFFSVRMLDDGDTAQHGSAVAAGIFDAQLTTNGNDNYVYNLSGGVFRAGFRTDAGDTGNDINYMIAGDFGWLFGSDNNYDVDSAIGMVSRWPGSNPTGATWNTAMGVLIEDTTNIPTDYRSWAVRIYAQDGTDSGASDGNFWMDGGHWNTGHIKLGNASLYEDDSDGWFRIKNGTPSSNTSGKKVAIHSAQTNHGLMMWGDPSSSSYDTGTELCASQAGTTCDGVMDMDCPLEPGAANGSTDACGNVVATTPGCSTDMTSTGYFYALCK